MSIGFCAIFNKVAPNRRDFAFLQDNALFNANIYPIRCGRLTMHTLYCLPLGETVRDRFVAALAGAVAAGRGSEQAFLLPSAHLLGAVRRDLRAVARPGYEQPHLLAFDDLVKEIVALAGCPHRLMDRMTQELVVADVLERLKMGGELPYFKSIAAFPGYVSTVTSLLAEIKRTGASPDEFAAVAEARDWPAKDREIHAIYEAYQAALAARELADLEELYFLAVAALEAGLALPYNHIYISEFYILTPLQLELVRQLRRTAAIDVGIIYEKNRPEVFAAVEPTYGALVGMGFTPVFPDERRQTAASLAHIRRTLFAPHAPAAEDAAGVTAISCPSRAKEMTVAAAAIKKLLLSGTCRPEEIAVVVRDVGAWADFAAVCDSFGLPVSLAREQALADQAPARLLAAALAAQADGGSRHAVINLIKSPLAAAALAIDADAVEQAALGRVIRSWRDWTALFTSEAAKERLAPSRPGFDRLRRLVTRLPREGVGGRYTGALRKLLDTLDIPATLGETYRAGLLPKTALKAGLQARENCQEMLDALDEGFSLAGRADNRLTAGEFLRYFRQAMADAKRSVRLADSGELAVQVVSPKAVRGVTFRAVFILGLTDGEFPLREPDNWLYDDRERAELRELLYLPTAADRRAEENLYFAVAVALTGDTLTVSCHEDAQTLPSPFMADLLRLFAPETVAREKYETGDLFPADYDGVYSAAELAGKALLATRGSPAADARDGAAAAYTLASLVDDDFTRRLAAEDERERGGPGPYDGLAAGADTPPVFSITALEDYAQCPFRYFTTHLLKLKEWEEKDEEAGFDIIGTIYHEVLATFLRAHRGRSLRPEAIADYKAELAAILDDVCRRLTVEGVIFAGKTWDYRQRRLAATLERWLDYEIAEQTGDGLAFTPAFLEWGFGLPVTPGMDPASVTEPLELAAGEDKVRVVGKVDRIDAAGDKLSVIDYKRKSTPRFRDIDAGLDLQAALYIMAAERCLCPDGGQVTGGGYYSVENRKKDGGMWRAELADAIAHRSAKEAGNLDAAAWDSLQAELIRAVGRYSAAIRDGIFPVRPASDCPPYCVARTVCRYRPEQARPEGGERLG